MKLIKAVIIAIICTILIGWAIRGMIQIVECARDICRHADMRLAVEVLR